MKEEEVKREEVDSKKYVYQANQVDEMESVRWGGKAKSYRN